MKARNISVCGNDFDLSEPPKTAPNPFSVSSVRFGRVSDMRENHSVAVEPEPVSVQAEGGLPTPRAQFINNGFGLGEFLGKRGVFDGYLFLQCVFMLTLVIVYTNNVL